MAAGERNLSSGILQLANLLGNLVADCLRNLFAVDKLRLLCATCEDNSKQRREKGRCSTSATSFMLQKA